MGGLVVLIILGIMWFVETRENKAKYEYYTSEAQKHYAAGNTEIGDMYTRQAVSAKMNR